MAKKILGGLGFGGKKKPAAATATATATPESKGPIVTRLDGLGGTPAVDPKRRGRGALSQTILGQSLNRTLGG